MLISCASVSAVDVDDPIISEPQSEPITLGEVEPDTVDVAKASAVDDDPLTAKVEDPVNASTLPIYDDSEYSHHHVYDVTPTPVGEDFLNHIIEVSEGVYFDHPQHPTNVFWTGVEQGTMYVILDMGGNEQFKINNLKGITGLSSSYTIMNNIVAPNGTRYSTICLIRFDGITGTTSNGGVTIVCNQRPNIALTGIKIYNQTNMTLYVNDKFNDTIYYGEDATLKADVYHHDDKIPVTTGIVYYYLYKVNGTEQFIIDDLHEKEPIGNSAPGGTIPLEGYEIGDYEFIAWYPEDDVGQNFESHSNFVTLHVIEPPKLDLSVDKKANVTYNDPNDNSLTVGDYVKFTIEVTNNDEVNNATGVVVNDKIPTGLLFVSSNDTENYDSETGDWKVGSLNAGESKTLEIIARVTTVSPVTNTATITACRENDTDSSNNVSSITLYPHTQGISLMVTKEVSDKTPLYGDDITYTITVINLGSKDALNIVVNDLLPNGLKFVSSSDETNYNSGTGDWNVGTVAAGKNSTLTITATVDSVDPITNIAKITGHDAQQEDPITEDDEASVTINPIRKFDLEVSKIIDGATSDTHFSFGDSISYIITVTNNGPCDATDIEVTDIIPGGLIDVSTNGTHTITGQKIVWTIASLANQSSISFKVDATINTVGLITNTVNITKSNGTDTNPDDDGDSVDLTSNPKYDLEVTIEVTNPEVLNGQVVEYIITVTNHGPTYAENVVVNNLYPPEFEYVSDNSTDESYLEKRSSYLGKLLGSDSGFEQSTGEWTIGHMNNGDTYQLAILIKATKVGEYTIKDTVVADDYKDYDTNLENNEATATVKVNPCADLSIEKSVDKTEITVGDTVTYTITVTNNGPDDATGVEVSDGDITKHTFVSASDEENYDSSSGVWTVGNLANGETKTLTITVKFTEAGDFANTATVSSNQGDNDTSNNNASSDNVKVSKEPVDPVDPVDPIDPVDPVDPIDPVNPDEPVKVSKEPVLPKAGNPILVLLFALMVLTGAMFERKE